MKHTSALGLAVSFFVSSPLFAQTPATPPAQQPQARRIEAALAKEAVETAIAACAAQDEACARAGAEKVASRLK